MNISSRLMLGAMVLTGIAVILAAGTTGWLALQQTNRALSQNLEQRFQALAEGRAQAVATQFSSYAELLLSLSHGRMTQEAVYGFIRPFASYRYEVSATPEAELRTQLADWYQQTYAPYHRQLTRGQPADARTWVEGFSLETLLIQQRYLQANPSPINALDTMEDAADATIYGQQHRRYHSSFRDLTRRFGFSDLLIVDSRSLAVIYSVNKSSLLGDSLATASLASSPLAQLARSLQRAHADQVLVSRFHSNPRRFEQQLVYVGVPVFHDVQSPHKAIGLLIAEIPVTRLTQIMSAQQHWQSLGLGETGDIYLVDSSQRLLTELREVQQAPMTAVADLQQTVTGNLNAMIRLQQAAGNIQIATYPVREALAGRAGTGMEQDYLGRTMFTSWQPLVIGDQALALVAQQRPEEVFAAVAELRGTLWRSVVIASIVLTGLAAVLAFFFSRSIGKPLVLLAHKIKRAAEDKNLASEFPAQRRDELGEMGRSLNFLFAELNRVLVQVNQSSEQSLQGALDNVTTTRQCRDETARQRHEMNHVGAETEAVVKSMSDISQHLDTVTRQVSLAQEAAGQGQVRARAVVNEMQSLAQQVADSCATLTELRTATGNIGSVLDTIQGVAEQTNLLALNAAIEAARAGEQGRGFAVVAEEVRRLSFDTQKATGEIKDMIDQLRASVGQISIGLAAEQETAQRCMDETLATQTALDRIQQSVADANQLTQRINLSAQDESNRAQAMRNRLVNLVSGINETDQAIARLAQGAEQQNQLANQAMRAAKVLTFSRAR
ncbi:methyl-accepting chemotaxis protein [Cellvibrio japonicus]|uniref:Putative methyl-accepting chemotaxis protein n=1 Tax=Cellvibrio japonicus (strain Ueda107) TaxID=498211 RepID=B3PGC7_CELJU|nr:methyl-accepting chemotaxis protein [Cellvibrio japonicus]ACE82874.1 putative methyl-accepting chemotaxis protein [Cellvibrio japonicus Ueda107]QEI10924.1 methyl-accepting chemotaxis protein [Cellvibrio japonicus]QEI14500.1 methyl-accepting chemotaxis protein [Cellvibrio japonicus]QEI18078.1 methyl-accepting chemotaxis protein [Cellvibrio japonicus]